MRLDKQQRIRQRELVYRGLAFDVYRYTIEIAGRPITREIIERTDGVVIVPVHRDGRVVMLREYCAGSDSYILSLPGGSVKPGCNLEEDALRELREETGFSARELLKLRFAFTHPATSTRRSHTFLAYDLFHSPLPSSGEELEVVTLPFGKAISHAYEDFSSDVSTIGSLLMAREMLQKLGRWPVDDMRSHMHREQA